MKTSSVKKEYLRLLLCSSLQRARLFNTLFCFSAYAASAFSGYHQGRYLYLTAITALFPNLLQLLIPAIKNQIRGHRPSGQNSVKKAPVYFPALRKQLHYSDLSFIALLTSALLYLFLLLYLGFDFLSKSLLPDWLVYSPFAVLAASFITSIILFCCIHHKIDRSFNS